MEFRVLGPLRLRVGNQWTKLSAPKQRTILGLLLVNANHVVSFDRVLEEVWGDRQPAGGIRTLRYQVSKLRDSLEPNRTRGESGVLGTEAGGYVLHADSAEIDAQRFERLAGEGARALTDGRIAAAREQLEEGLGLWRGEAFADFRYEQFAQGEIARLEETRLVCLENRLAADLKLGRHREVVGELGALTKGFPMRERFWGQLMVALYRSDQQADALRAYQAAHRVLGEELGVEPNAALRRLEEQILLHELPFQAPAFEAPDRDNLPVRIDTFVGRAEEVRSVEKLVDRYRLVTLTGFGGIGKTSLAVEVARIVIDNYPDGVWLIELAAFTDPSYVIGAIAEIFGVPEHPSRPLLDMVIQELSAMSTLIVIDNCEHLVDEVARVVGALLERCPALRVLATSRDSLRVAGEQIWPVPPLDLPDVRAATSIVSARETDAVRLFLERAHQAQPGFDLRDSNIRDVVAICRMLDGIPLALELAAARMRVLSPGQLLDRLEDRFALLTGGGESRPERHRTLEATIEWSYDLLTTSERALLSRLAVFEGGFTLMAAEAVCSGDGIDRGDILDLINRLVDASLITVQTEEPRRYGMLESLHEFMKAVLTNSHEERTQRQRHADYFGTLVPREPDFDTTEFSEALVLLAREQDNFRSALAWTVRVGDGDRALRLATKLRLHWYYHAKRGETLYWVPQVLEVTEAAPSRERARILQSHGVALAYSGRELEAAAVADELERVAAHLGDPTVSGYAAILEAARLDAMSQPRAAAQIYKDRVLALHDLPPTELALHLTNTSWLEVNVGNLDSADQYVDRTESLGSSLGQPMIIAEVAAMRGMLANYRGDLPTAHRLLTEALGEHRRLDRVSQQANTLRELAQVALASPDVDEAEQWARQLIDNGRRMLISRDMAEGYTLLARAELGHRRIAPARAAAAEALDVALESDDTWALALLLDAVGQIAWATNDALNATVMHAAAEALRATVGFVRPTPRTRELERQLLALRESLGTDSFRHAWQEGTEANRAQLVDGMRHVITPSILTKPTT
jgi:predicted ATPase/DNA-binding SARP family transcriptional activator